MNANMLQVAYQEARVELLDMAVISRMDDPFGFTADEGPVAAGELGTAVDYLVHLMNNEDAPLTDQAVSEDLERVATMNALGTSDIEIDWHNKHAQGIQRSLVYLTTRKVYPKPIRCFLYPCWDCNTFDVIFYIYGKSRRIIYETQCVRGIFLDVLEDDGRQYDTYHQLANGFKDVWGPDDYIEGWKNGSKEYQRIAGLVKKALERGGEVEPTD